MRSDADRLADVLEAIEKIESYAEKGQDAFSKDELIQVWTIHHIQIIGEAASGLSEEFKLSHKTIPWQDIIAMRHVLVHHYFGIDLQQVWDTVCIDIPKLKEDVKIILDNL